MIGDGIVTIVIFAVMLGALVIIHELGHFVTARLAGIRVLEFGIGFPPRAKVLSNQGETLYTLNWLPIGGFVRLEGEDGETDDPRSFVRARLPIKLIVLVSGVVMNLVLAFVIFTGIAWFPGEAWGLRISSVQVPSPAASSGLTIGDTIVAVDGTYYDRFDGFEPLMNTLQSQPGQTVNLGIVHADGTQATVPVRLRSLAEIDSTHRALGVAFDQFRRTSVGFTRTAGDALALGAERTVDAFRLIVDGLGKIADSIATRPTEAPPAAGPVGIAIQVGDVFREAGPLATLYLAGILSANLALVNILPLPPLDGGRILMILIKQIAGARLSLQAERVTYLVGFVFLFAFLIWITYFDIARLGAPAAQ